MQNHWFHLLEIRVIFNWSKQFTKSESDTEIKYKPEE